jgi:hypothetical protein
MKAFGQYSDQELLTLTNEEINDAIRITAIERGIKPPISLSEAIHRSEWRGFEFNGDGMTFFRVRSTVGYSESASPFCYLTEEAARASTIGMFAVKDEGYGPNAKKVVHEVEPSIERVFVPSQASRSKALKFEEYYQDDKDFDAVVTECTDRLSKARQDDYNKRVYGERKKEYMRLAGGNEEIAKAFWAKAERTDWPVE